MTSSDDILAQIDGAVDDDAVSYDAMRWTPDQPRLPEGPRVQMSFGVGPREILIRRLVEQHGLTRPTARHAVLAAERGDDSERARLAAAEAQAVAAEMAQRIRIVFQPMAQAAITALRELGESLKRIQIEPAVHGKPAPRRDRPAWQTPYGPARRRR